MFSAGAKEGDGAAELDVGEVAVAETASASESIRADTLS